MAKQWNSNNQFKDWLKNKPQTSQVDKAKWHYIHQEYMKKESYNNLKLSATCLECGKEYKLVLRESDRVFDLTKAKPPLQLFFAETGIGKNRGCTLCNADLKETCVVDVKTLSQLKKIDKGLWTKTNERRITNLTNYKNYGQN